jgi:hypothetical protein
MFPENARNLWRPGAHRWERDPAHRAEADLQFRIADRGCQVFFGLRLPGPFGVAMVVQVPLATSFHELPW